MRRKRRRRLRFRPVLWLLLAINLGAAAYASRITSLRHIEVVGVRPYDKARVDAILAPLRGVPDLQVSRTRVETEVLREPSVRSAEFRSNMLGNGELRVGYRLPVARLLGSHDLALDEEGVVYTAPDLPEDLTPLQLFGSVPPTLVGAMGDWQAKRLAGLAVEVRALGIPEGVGIEVDGEGAICLNVGSGRVLLGSCDDLDHKLKVLRLRLQKNRDELSQIEVLNLTDPDSPTVVKRK